MAVKFPKELVGVRDGTKPPLKTDGRVVNAKLRISRFSIDTALNPVAAGDQIHLGTRAIGTRYAGHRITASASMGAATLAIGTATEPNKYRDPAVFQATDNPVPVGKAARLADDPLTVQEDNFVTVAVAPLSPGILVIERYETYE